MAEESTPSVKDKQAWLKNAFSKKGKTEPEPRGPRAGNSLVQERHKWIEEELQLRKSLKSQGKSELAISQELIAAKKRWLDIDNERKNKETADVPSPARGKKFVPAETKKSEEDAGTKPDASKSQVNPPAAISTNSKIFGMTASQTDQMVASLAALLVGSAPSDEGVTAEKLVAVAESAGCSLSSGLATLFASVVTKAPEGVESFMAAPGGGGGGGGSGGGGGDADAPAAAKEEEKPEEEEMDMGGGMDMFGAEEGEGGGDY
jgi:hypothetical protein